MLMHLADQLRKSGIAFEDKTQWIRCFPHVVNIAVKAGLKQLTELLNPEDEDLLEFFADKDIDWAKVLTEDTAYVESLQTDVVARCHSLVKAIRGSGQRRDDLGASITHVNAESAALGLEVDPIPDYALLRDVDTHWSSTFLMIDRMLQLYPAVEHYLSVHTEIKHSGLSEKDLKVLADI
ncbi:hypothetical protein CONPUDRAFT_160350 [Coniophora puteana RWD-64-598 SS2]|uniref:Uncharacterized protein n=1 Tax=Coniophora puteana (strain RWD-64-598) TaxID=741705 RepID=R7SEB7_CONPW|nr:uncharacterized protein CONPUDRAFT_160350 [Coniophora puteana RWD-64-598 SS2]EIW74092.1 hypothetical protein CONPUDRAFT_160350 [Coniophora puteana RWD-64-598 SS2]